MLAGADSLGERTVKRKAVCEQGVASYGAVGSLPKLIEAFEQAKKAPRQAEIVKLITEHNLPFEGTDCALPMIWAREHKLNISGFITYTNSETWAGNIHPAQALREYRSEFVGDAKAVVVGMTSNGFTLADPNQRGMLGVVGFDMSVSRCPM